MTDSTRFVIWVHRSANSIFGAASHPIDEDGTLLAFSEERDAWERCDRLNANTGNPHVFYSVENTDISVGHACDQAEILELTPELEVAMMPDIAA